MKRVLKKENTQENEEHAVVPIANPPNLKSGRKSVLAKPESDDPATQYQYENLFRFEEQKNAELAPTGQELSIEQMTQQLNERLLGHEEIEETENSVEQLTEHLEEIAECQQELNEQIENDTQQVEQESVSEVVEETVVQVVSEQELVQGMEPVYVTAEIVKSIESLFNWNDALTYQQYRSTMHKFNSRLDNNTKKTWDKSIKQAIEKMKKSIEYINHISKGVRYMENKENLLKDIFAEELHNLKPLDMFVETIAPAEYGLGDIVTEIKTEIKNGTKVSYKMIQELQTQLEAMQHIPLEAVATTNK